MSLNQLDHRQEVFESRGGATIGAGGVIHPPPFFQILVFLLYWPPTFQYIDPPPTFKFVAPPLFESGHNSILPAGVIPQTKLMMSTNFILPIMNIFFWVFHHLIDISKFNYQKNAVVLRFRTEK